MIAFQSETIVVFLYPKSVSVKTIIFLQKLITLHFQASLLSNAMFNCGWHLCKLENKSHHDIRKLVLVGCAQAQKPLVLKAFGIQDLSYETFVSVSINIYCNIHFNC